MAKPRLFIDDDRSYYRITWYLPDEGDHGATLGESRYTRAHLERAKCDDDWEHIAATIAVSEAPGVQRDRDGYYWESRKDAVAALRTANTVLKNRKKPWPEWALQAQAAGWKAPKGWKP